MKYFYLLFLLFYGLFYSHNIWADSIPLNGDWEAGGLRSVIEHPFSVDKEGDALYIYCSVDVEDVTVRIVSAATGEEFYDNTYSFFSSDCIVLPLDGLSEGEYIVIIYFDNSFLSGCFVGV